MKILEKWKNFKNIKAKNKEKNVLLGITPPPEEPKKKKAPSPIDIKEARLNGIQKQVTETRNAN